MGQPVTLLDHASELEELETAIAYLRECQSELKKEANDPQKAQFIKEWLIDLYTIRKHHPEYKKTDPKVRMKYKMKKDDDILLIDPDLINIKARTEFSDPFEMSTEWQESAVVRELMDGLTLMEYEAVTMCWLNGLGPTEAAHYMGCSTRNVSTYLIRARTKMIAKYRNSSQMVLSGFDFPPTIRRHRSKDNKASSSSNTSEISPKEMKRTQLTFFQE